MSSEVFSMWEYDFPNTWDYLARFDYIYDNFGDLIELIRYDWYYYWEVGSRSLKHYDTAISKDFVILPVNYDYHDIGQKMYYFRVHKIINSIPYYHTNQNTWLPTGDSVIYYYSDINTGIHAIEKETAISVYPCPATTHISVSGLEPQKHCIAHIYDLSGKLIKYQEISEASISVSDLVTGYYILEILSDGSIFYRTKVCIL